MYVRKGKLEGEWADGSGTQHPCRRAETTLYVDFSPNESTTSPPPLPLLYSAPPLTPPPSPITELPTPSTSQPTYPNPAKVKHHTATVRRYHHHKNLWTLPASSCHSNPQYKKTYPVTPLTSRNHAVSSQSLWSCFLYAISRNLSIQVGGLCGVVVLSLWRELVVGG